MRRLTARMLSAHHVQGNAGPNDTLNVGDRLAAYVIDGTLGQGGMGMVYRAHTDADATTVALKVLKSHLASDETYRRRFLHEVRSAREVRHRHLVPILDSGEADGSAYLTMPCMVGGSLEDRFKSGPIPVAELLRMVSEVASGLDALHKQGIIHRDIKPANIMFDQTGSAAVADFGLAKSEAYTLLTQVGQVLGTLDYMAPEIVEGKPATAHSDVYAFGCVVFECVSGSPPFGGKSVFEVGLAHLQEPPPDPCAGRDDLPSEFSWAVLQALAKEADRRPPTATAYSNMLSLATGPRRL
jgi:serine/threonine protein kinase